MNCLDENQIDVDNRDDDDNDDEFNVDFDVMEEEKTCDSENIDENESKLNEICKQTPVAINDISSKYSMLKPCTCKLKKCHDNIDEHSRQIVHDGFWQLDYNERRMWIFNHIEQYEPKRRYAKNAGIKSRIQLSSHNWLPVENLPSRKLYVCKDMFLNTIGHISDKVITTALLTTSPVGINQGDKRGKHTPKHKAQDKDLNFLINHIRSFQPQIAHYRREHAPKRLYLPPELTIREMYVDYEEECERNETKKFSYVRYTRHIKEMNISFAKFGTEECEVRDDHLVYIRNINPSCEKNQQKLSKKIDRIEVCEGECENCSVWRVHHSKYVETRSAYKADKALVDVEKDTLFLSADMQKVILLPRMPSYKVCLFTSRLVVINQSFCPLKKEDLDKKLSLGVLWHEEMKGRNDEDVTSAFLKCLTSVEFRDYHHFTLWLDNCSGQNKNWTLYTALTHFINTTSGPQSITLKYFVAGHTFMSADSFHHRVETEMKKMKNGMILRNV